MTILNKWAMTLALICAFAAPAQAQRAVDATGPGGSVVEFAQRVSIARIQNAPVRFYGRCESACTLFLSLPASRTCIVPGASFSFHRARGAADDFNQWGTDYMMSRYPEWVRAWINAHGGLTHRLGFAWTTPMRRNSSAHADRRKDRRRKRNREMKTGDGALVRPSLPAEPS